MTPLRKKIILGLIAGYFVFMAAYAYNAHRQKRALEEDTLAFLESEGYETETDVEDWFIGSSSGWNRFYVMYVTFEDKPGATYLYTYIEETEDIFLYDTIDSRAGQP